jgi:hypothetical protein
LKLDDSERSYLEKDLLDITHRTYLWLKLIFEVIEDSLFVTQTGLRSIIGTIPDTFEKAYEAILERSTDKKKRHGNFFVFLFLLSGHLLYER